jgi:hypothetical protein
VASPLPSPAIATSIASTRLSASRFRSIAAFQSTAVSFQARGASIAPIGKGVDKALTYFLAKECLAALRQDQEKAISTA